MYFLSIKKISLQVKNQNSRMIRRNGLLLFGLLFLMSIGMNACFVIPNQFSGLAPGPWRGVLKLELNPVTPNPKGEPLPEKMNLEFEEVTQGQLPFNFEVIYDSEESFHIELLNGEERIILDDITMGIDRATAKDTVIIEFPVFDSYIKAIYEESVLEGVWIDRNRENYSIPFVAYHGQDYRFTNLQKKPKMDLSGKWETTFEVDTEDAYKAIGEFKQNGNDIQGTFLTETGDYRYLEGTVQGNKMYMSVFDGAHAFLFEAKIMDDSSLIGSFRSGTHYRTTWEAKRNPEFELTDPNELTFLKEGYDRVSFTFPNADNQIVSLEDSKYQNKVTIVQILGTWCPNCRDEVKFLNNYLKEHPDMDLEVVGIAFEKKSAKTEALAGLRRYQENMDLQYDLLYGGYYEKEQAARALPMLNHVLSYPTMIILDRQGKVRRIHTGFNGPATSKYESFKNDFDRFIQQLVSEQM